MDGVYLLYTAAASPAQRSTQTSNDAGPSTQGETRRMPSVIVLTQPQRPLAGCTSAYSTCPVCVCDVDLLQVLYLAFPSTFFVLVSPCPRPADEGSLEDELAARAPQPGSTWYEAYGRAQERVKAFFDSPFVQQRTCRLTLGSSSSYQGVPSSSSQRHSLQLSPLAAARIMHHQPWLKDLHECPQTLCFAAQVAATLLLHPGPTTTRPFYLSAATTLELVVQCEWMGDAPTAAALLTCVSRTISARAAEEMWRGTSAGLAALARAQRGAPPLMPRWICGRIMDGSNSSDFPCDNTNGNDVDVMPSNALPLLSVNAYANSKHINDSKSSGCSNSTNREATEGKNKNKKKAKVKSADQSVQLCIEEAYCTYTSETSIGASAAVAPPVNVLGGSIGMLLDSSAAPAPAPNTSFTDAALPAETVHVLVCTALGGAASEYEEDAVRPLAGDLLPPLLSFLHNDFSPSTAANAAAASAMEPTTRLQLYLTVNGRDVLAATPEEQREGEDEDVDVTRSLYGPSYAQPRQQQQQHRRDDAASPNTPLVGGTVEEAYARIPTADVNRPSFEGADEDLYDRDTRSEPHEIISYMFTQCEATLRLVQQEAHRQRLTWVRHQALTSTVQPPLTSSASPSEGAPSSSSPSAIAAASTTRAAIVLCADEYHLAQWAESGHLLATLSRSTSYDGRSSSGGGSGDGPGCLPPQWALYAGVPIYICLLPSSAVSPPRLLSRLCDAPSIVRGVRAARQLCTRTHGFFFIGNDHDHPSHDPASRRAHHAESNDDNDYEKAAAAAAAAQKRVKESVTRGCEAVMAAVVAHLHAWVAAVYRDVHWCVFSELLAEGKSNSRAKRSGASDARAPLPDSLPHCEVCAPAMVATVRSATAHVRLWRCPETLLSPATPAAPFLAYEAIPSQTTRDAAALRRAAHPAPTTSTAPTPWIEELVAQYAFAFAHARHGGGVLCAVSAVVRVQPRLALFKPGPLLQWYNRQFHLHHASVLLAAVLEAQVEQVKSMFFVLAATEGGRNVRRGVVSAREREAQAAAVVRALQRLTSRVVHLKEGEQALLNTLRHLLPFESLDDRRTVAVAHAAAAASPLYTSQRVTAPLPAPLLAVIAEVEDARRTQFREQQRKEYQLGEPLAPSSADSSAAVARLLSLVFLRARSMEIHARYAACGGDYLVQRTHEVLTAKRTAISVADVPKQREGVKAASLPPRETETLQAADKAARAPEANVDVSCFYKSLLAPAPDIPVTASPPGSQTSCVSSPVPSQQQQSQQRQRSQQQPENQHAPTPSHASSADTTLSPNEASSTFFQRETSEPAPVKAPAGVSGDVAREAALTVTPSPSQSSHSAEQHEESNSVRESSPSVEGASLVNEICHGSVSSAAAVPITSHDAAAEVGEPPHEYDVTLTMSAPALSVEQRGTSLAFNNSRNCGGPASSNNSTRVPPPAELNTYRNAFIRLRSSDSPRGGGNNKEDGERHAYSHQQIPARPISSSFDVRLPAATPAANVLCNTFDIYDVQTPVPRERASSLSVSTPLESREARAEPDVEVRAANLGRSSVTSVTIVPDESAEVNEERGDGDDQGEEDGVQSWVYLPGEEDHVKVETAGVVEAAHSVESHADDAVTAEQDGVLEENARFGKADAEADNLGSCDVPLSALDAPQSSVPFSTRQQRQQQQEQQQAMREQQPEQAAHFSAAPSPRVPEVETVEAAADATEDKQEASAVDLVKEETATYVETSPLLPPLPPPPRPPTPPLTPSSPCPLNSKVPLCSSEAEIETASLNKPPVAAEKVDGQTESDAAGFASAASRETEKNNVGKDKQEEEEGVVEKVKQALPLLSAVENVVVIAHKTQRQNGEPDLRVQEKEVEKVTSLDASAKESFPARCAALPDNASREASNSSTHTHAGPDARSETTDDAVKEAVAHPFPRSARKDAASTGTQDPTQRTTPQLPKPATSPQTRVLAKEQHQPSPRMESKSPVKPSLNLPSPPRDLRWCCKKPATMATTAATAAGTSNSRLTELLTTHLPSSAVSQTSAVHVARYAGGTLTVDVLDPTVACVAACSAAAPLSDISQQQHQEKRKMQPSAHLALFSIDTASGALRLLEAQPCAIAPGADRPTFSPPQSLLSPAQRGDDNRSGSGASISARSQYTFERQLSSADAVAVVYVGLRVPLHHAATAADVLWVSGIACTVVCPSLRQVRVSAVQAHALVLEWHAATSSPRTAVKVLVTELATPPLDVVSVKDKTASPSREIERSELKAETGMQRQRSVVHVGHTSPTTIAGLRSAAIYHVQLIPIPAARQSVALPPLTSAGQPQGPVVLDCVVDAEVSPCAVLAATSVAPSLDFLRIGQVMVAKTVELDATATNKDNKNMKEVSALTNYDGELRSAPSSAFPLVTGKVESPLLHYRTAAFPASLLRHYTLPDLPVGADAASQLIRLHLTLVPIFNRDVQPERATDDYAADGDSSKDHFKIAAEGSTTSARNSGGAASPWRYASKHCGSSSSSSSTCRHVFNMRPGEEVGVCLSFGIQLDAELVRSAAVFPPAMQYVAVFDALQRRVLRAVLGPFNVCGAAVSVPHVSTSTAELVWEGTCPVFDVAVVRRQTAVDALSGAVEAHEMMTAAVQGTAAAVEHAGTVEGGRDELVYRVTGVPVCASENNERQNSAAATTAAASLVPCSPSAIPSRYRAKLRLSHLYPASAYEVQVRCAANHIGEALQGAWHTTPPPPPASALCAVFDSATRQLRLRFAQHRATAAQKCDSSRTRYQLVASPLGTTIHVPVVAIGSADDTPLSQHSTNYVERVVDCSVVAASEPITLHLRQSVSWSSAADENEIKTSSKDTPARLPDEKAVTPLTTIASEEVVFCVVSDVRVSAVRKTEPAAAGAGSVLEVTWTCGRAANTEQTVAFVEFNGKHLLPVSGLGENRLCLTSAELQGAAATTAVDASSRQLTQETHVESQHERNPVSRLWTGLLCVTGFKSGAAPTAVSVKEKQGVLSPRPQMVGLLVPDRCHPVILPPPPPVPASMLLLQNYQDEAVLEVDVSAVYRLYDKTLFVSDGESNSSSANPTHSVQELVKVVRERLCLALEVRRGKELIAGRSEEEGCAVHHYPLAPPQQQQPPRQQQQWREQPWQRVRVPLPAYRPYNDQLYVTLHVSVATTITPTHSNSNSSSGAAAQAASHTTYKFFTPIPSSPSALALPIPPAEPILDVTVAAITAHDAVVDWTPPLSLLRHLRQHPSTPVAYEVRLHPATPLARSKGHHSPPLATTRSRVWISAEPHLVLDGLQPATLYEVQVRGTGFGNYYATRCFLTAPVVAAAVVTQLRASLTVEAVVRDGEVSLDDKGTSSVHTERSALKERRNGQGVQKQPALWAVLPASSVVAWTLPSAHKHAVREAVSQAAEKPPRTTTAEREEEEVTASVEVATHYTVSLVAANGELLRQWTSSPNTTTTLYHEWDSSSESSGGWPHLEVMAHAQLVLPAEGSGYDFGREEGVTDLADQSRPRSPISFVTPHASQSGAYCRTRLDLIGMPRLVEPPSPTSPSSPPWACAMAWTGSSPEGYCVSWCLSTDCADVRHVTFPATASFHHTLSISATEIREAVSKHRRGACAREGDAAAPTGLSEAPLFILACVSARLTETTRALKTPGLAATESAVAGAPSVFASTRLPTGVCSAGSNVLCVAWLLPSNLTTSTPQRAAVVYQTAARTTLLLPSNYPTERTREEHVSVAEAAVPPAITNEARSASLTTDVQLLLKRTWSLVPKRPTVNTTSQSQDTLSVHVWTHEHYINAGLAVTASPASPAGPSPLNGMTLADVQTPVSPPHSTSVEANTLELRCVETVTEKQAGAWRRLAEYILQQQHHKRHFSEATHSSDTDPCRAVPPLRWLRSSVQTSRELRVPAVCALEQLELVSVEEAGVVSQPPLVTAGMKLNAPAMESSRGDGAPRGTVTSESNARRLTTRSWLPLRSSKPLEELTPATKSATAENQPPCRLVLSVGEHEKDEEENTSPQAGEDEAVTPLTKTTARDATLAELEALQTWSQHGHPTLRARFAFVSSDDEFVLRVAGPYEAADPRNELSSVEKLRAERQVGDSAADVNFAGAQGKFDAFQIVRRLHALASPNVFPTVREMPHQRTYTCVPAAAQGTAPNDSPYSTAYLSLQPDGKVVSVVTSAEAAAPPSNIKVADAEVTPLTHEGNVRLGTRYEVEVDGLLPEAFYRVQVTGRRCGDAALRLQFITPPSNLTQLVTVSEVVLDAPPQEAEDIRVALSAAKRLTLHARVYDPHAFARQPEAAQRQLPCHLAPGLRYSAHAALEVWGAKSKRCLQEHHTHAVQDASVAREEGEEKEHERVEEALPVTESAFAMKVEEAVEVYAVRHIDVVLTDPSADASRAFLQTHIWGRVLLKSAATSPEASEPAVLTLDERNPRHCLHARLPLCHIPQLPRMDSLAVQRRSPHSLQLSWRWWSTQSSTLPSPPPQRCSSPSTPSTPPPTVLCVRCCRLYSENALSEVHDEVGRRQQQQQQKDVDGCTVILPVSTSPTVALAPLQPGSLYAISVREIPHECAAAARAVSPSASLDALFLLSPPSQTHRRRRTAELYAVRPLPLPSPATAAAVRALASVSARPAALLLLEQRPRVDTSVSSQGALRAGFQVPRGAVLCYALTPSLPLTLAPAQTLMDSIRRRPAVMSVSLPLPYAATQLRSNAEGSGTVWGVRVLSYVAAVVVPENVVYVPKDAAADMQAWWATTHNDLAEEELWVWWAKRMQSTIDRDWLHRQRQQQQKQSDTIARQKMAHRRSSSAVDAVQEHWNSELGRRLVKACRTGTKEGLPEQALASSWCLRIRVMEEQQQSSAATAYLRFAVPVTEPTLPFTPPSSAVVTANSVVTAAASRAVYFVRCVEALPTATSALQRVGHYGVVGGSQQLTVCHAPLTVKKLQLVREVSVRGTISAATVNDSNDASNDISSNTNRVDTAAKDRAAAELRLQWKWPAWVQTAATAPQLESAELRSEEGVVCAAKRLRPCCTARLTCTVIGSTEEGKANAKQGDPAADTADANARDAVFLQHLEDGQREASIRGLRPVTLYRIVFDHVCFKKDDTRICCGEKAVTALTPPTPPGPHSLPQLHYTVLPPPPASVDPAAGTATAAFALDESAERPSRRAPAGVEVRFDLPAATQTDQGLLLCHYSLLVNLDAVDVAACRTADDFLAAAQGERVAPHLRTVGTAVESAAKTNPQAVKLALKEATEKEAPVVYVNTSVQHRLRTCVTLRDPLQQRYALVFFKAVLLGWRHEESSEEAQKHMGKETLPSKAPHSTPRVEAHPLSNVEKVLYSAPVLKPLHYPAAVRAAYNAVPATRPLDLHDVTHPRWRRLLCRPSRLIVQQRTATCLTLRWQLDLSVARLSDMERLKLLRHGVFVVRIAAADPPVVPALQRTAVCAAPSDSSVGGLTPPLRQKDAMCQHSAGGSRTVFYRANAASPGPSKVTPPSSAPSPAPPQRLLTSSTLSSVSSRSARERKDGRPEEVKTEVLRVPVCDYLASVDDDNGMEREEETTKKTIDAGEETSQHGSEVHNSSPDVQPREDNFKDGQAASSQACLTYELPYLCRSYAAGHTGFTVEVSLSPDWYQADTTGGPPSTLSNPAHALLSSTPSIPVEHTSVSLTVPPVVLPLPVQRVTVTHLTQTSCTVSWAVAEAERPAAYRVQYTRHEVRCDCGAPDCVLEPEEQHEIWVRNTQQTSVQLENLRHHTSYTICVVPCNVYDEPCEANNATVTVHTY